MTVQTFTLKNITITAKAGILGDSMRRFTGQARYVGSNWIPTFVGMVKMHIFIIFDLCF
jgi:hypothetical protein